MPRIHQLRRNRLGTTSVFEVVIVVFASFVLPPVVAQSANALSATNGRSEVISIGVGKTVLRSFAGTKGNLIIYGVGNYSTDSYLNFNIFNSAGKRVDGCFSFCSEMSGKASQYTFVPPATGTYILALYFSKRSVAGSIGLSLLDVIKNPPQTFSGTTTASVLSTDVVRVYQFASTKGNLIIYGVGNNSTESYLNFNIFNSTGKRVDGCFSFCSEMPNRAGQHTFVPPATGTHFLALYFSKRSVAGSIGLSLLDVIKTPPQTFSGPFTASVLPTDVMRVYQLAGTQGKQLIYEVGNYSLESTLNLNIFNSTGKRVDGCLSFCSELSNEAGRYTFAPSATGTYFLALYFSTPSTVGSFRLAFL